MVTVFGLGFVGLTTALGFANLGYKVYGVDIDPKRCEILQQGHMPFSEPYLEKELRRQIGKNLIVSAESAEAVSDSEYVFFCVGTPYGENGHADLTYLYSAIDQALMGIQDDKYRILVVKSTIPPSTTIKKIIPYIAERCAQKNRVGVANNPEFLREGHCWEDFIHADRIVLGTDDEKVAQLLQKLYEPMHLPMICVSYTTAEFVKYLSNTLLATLISFSNEMAQVADAIGGIDVAEAFRVLHMDKRWREGTMSSYVYPGCGYGGYCLPKDTCALFAQSKENGFAPPILQKVIETNEERPKRVAKKILGALGNGNRVAILGLAFKPDSDDVRDTPAKKIIQELQNKEDIVVYAYDPIAMQEFRLRYPQVDIVLCDSADEACQKSDVIAIVTAWPQFREVDFCDKPVVDCRYMMP